MSESESFTDFMSTYSTRDHLALNTGLISATGICATLAAQGLVNTGDRYKKENDLTRFKIEAEREVTGTGTYLPDMESALMQDSKAIIDRYTKKIGSTIKVDVCDAAFLRSGLPDLDTACQVYTGPAAIWARYERLIEEKGVPQIEHSMPPPQVLNFGEFIGGATVTVVLGAITIATLISSTRNRFGLKELPKFRLTLPNRSK